VHAAIKTMGIELCSFQRFHEGNREPFRSVWHRSALERTLQAGRVLRSIQQEE